MDKRWLLLLALAAGCGGGASNGGDDATMNGSDGGGTVDASASIDLSTSGGPSTPGDFFQQYIGAYVDKVMSCCSASDMQTTQYKLGVGLIEAFGMLLGQVLEKGYEGGRLSYDAAAAADCLAQLKALLAAAQCGQPLQSMGQMMIACKPITAGKQAAGMPCAIDAECVDGLACVGYYVSSNGGAGSDGTCVAPPTGGAKCGAARVDGGGGLTFTLNGNLLGNHPQCANGFYCSSMTCVAVAQAGGQCFEDKQCAAGLTCHLQTCGMVGPSAAGAACKADSDCMAGLYCDQTQMKCATKKPAGQPCTGNFSSECAGRCSPPDGGQAGTCVTYCGSN